MAKKIIKAQMKQRLDTKANWASQNPVLLAGELGIVSDDPNLYKVGDGTTAWNALPFRGFNGTVVNETGTSETAVMSQKAVTEELAKLSTEIDKKIDADKMATINGQSLVEGGNITIEGGGALLKEVDKLATETFEVIEDGVVKSVGYDSAAATTYNMFGFIPKNQSKYRGIKAVYFQESAANLLDWNAVAVRQNADGYFYGVRNAPMVWNATRKRYDTSLVLEDGEMYAFMTNNQKVDTSGKPLGQIKSAEAFASADKEDYMITSASYANGILALDSSQAKRLDQYRGFFKHSILPMTEIYTREEGEVLEAALSKKADNPKYYGVNDTAVFANGLEYKDTCSVELWCKLYKPSANQTFFGSSLDQMRIYLFADGTLRGTGYDAGNYISIATNFKIEDGKPYHIVMTYDYSQNIVSMYINGQLRGSISVSGNNKLITNRFECKNSYIGYARLFGKALSADEVATLYNFGRPTQINFPIYLNDSLIYNYEQKNLSLEGWKNSVTEGMYDMTFTSPTLLELPLVNDAQDFSQIKSAINYDSVIAKTSRCKFDVVEFSRRNSHDCTFVNDRIWSFDKPTDGGGVISVNPDGTDGKRIIKTNFYDEKGLQLEMKSVDFARNMLLVGNGSATSWNNKDTYDHCAYVFYNALDWETIGNNAATAIDFNNCGAYTKINLSALGAKTYAFWGAPDTIYVSCNLFNDVYLVQLGKGTYNLGSGEYTEAGTEKYNGTYKVIKHWHQDGALGEWAAHGGQFYKDSLYLATNDPSKCLVYKVVLNEDGTMRFEELHFDSYPDSGQNVTYGQIKYYLKYSYIDGLCIKEGKLYAQPLNFNGQQKGTYVIVADL